MEWKDGLSGKSSLPKPHGFHKGFGPKIDCIEQLGIVQRNEVLSKV